MPEDQVSRHEWVEVHLSRYNYSDAADALEALDGLPLTTSPRDRGKLNEALWERDLALCETDGTDLVVIPRAEASECEPVCRLCLATVAMGAS